MAGSEGDTVQELLLSSFWRELCGEHIYMYTHTHVSVCIGACALWKLKGSATVPVCLQSAFLYRYQVVTFFVLRVVGGVVAHVCLHVIVIF